MLRTLQNTFPTYTLVFACILTAILLVLLVLVLKRRYYPILNTTEHNDMTVVLVRVLSALYSILLSLTIVALVHGYELASLSLVKEANSYSSAIESADTLPDAARVPIQKSIRDYVQRIVELEWPAMEQGLEFPTEIDQFIQRVYHEIAAYEPTTQSQKMFLGEVLNQFNLGLDSRAQRWVFSHNNVDTIVKGVLLFNAVSLLIMTCMLGSVKPRAQMVLTMLANSVVFAAFSLVVILDFPFSGEMAITPESFQELYNLYRAK